MIERARALAAALPDEPRWLETRAMLLNDHAELFGEVSPSQFVVRVFHGAVSAVAVVGAPHADALAAAIRGATELTPIIVQTGDVAAVDAALLAAGDDTWRSETAILHTLGAARASGRWREQKAEVRLLGADVPLAHLPVGLRHELTHARAFAPIAAVFLDGIPVSFCYPVWTTETWWDVSIDTLEPYRGRSLGAAAVALMIEVMRARGCEPVWAALASNRSSLRLGAKLGFTRVGEISVFSRGGWVFLSGGFTGA
jgi:GNAT superfamily N-acetyltransferase